MTVLFWGLHNEETNEYVVLDVYTEKKSENMQVAGKIVSWYNEKGADRINIDCIGIGVGVLSRVREILNESSVTINACHFGEGVGTAGKETRAYNSERLQERRSDSPKKRFSNRKAEQYFRLRDLFEERLMNIPKIRELSTELMNMKWENTSSGKIKIIDPERSPNYSDALVYFIWKVQNEVLFDF